MATHTASLTSWLLSLPPVDYALQSLKELLIGSLKCGPIPKHIAFVMDGNRRYARTHNLETVAGHHMGFEALARILEVCYKSGVQHVTIYAFSIENFKRSRYEVDGLMDMAKTKLLQMSQHGELLDRYGAAVRVLGDRSLVREDVLQQIDKAVNMTKHNDRAVLNVCFPYTSREEMTHAIRETVREYSEPVIEHKAAGKGKLFSESRVLRNLRTRQLASLPEEMEVQIGAESEADSTEVSEQDSDAQSLPQPASSQTSHSPSPVLKPTVAELKRAAAATSSQLPDPETITADTISKNTYTHPAPPLDLLVRTSGVRRLSDFMLWQCHEDTEIRFLECLWPEFDLWHFLPVLVEWQWRQKKMGEGRERTGRADSMRAS